MDYQAMAEAWREEQEAAREEEEKARQERKERREAQLPVTLVQPQPIGLFAEED